MPLQGPELEDFIRTYENCFGERITAEEANEMFARLMHLYRSIRRVETEDDGADEPVIEA